MSDPQNSTFTDGSVTFINDQVASAKASQSEAMAKAQQAVSQSMALAVQDATDNLRSFTTVNLAALSYAQEQLVATPALSGEWTTIITSLQAALNTQIGAFQTLSNDAGSILKNFMEDTQVSSTASTSFDSSENQGKPGSGPVAPSGPVSPPNNPSGPTPAPAALAVPSPLKSSAPLVTPPAETNLSSSVTPPISSEGSDNLATPLTSPPPRTSKWWSKFNPSKSGDQ